MATLKKIQAGEYQSQDGRFLVRSNYDPSGAPHCRTSRANAGWTVTNRMTGLRVRCWTLAECRELLSK